MSELVQRNTTSSTVRGWISNSSCWHLDTWLLELGGKPILLARTQRGTGAIVGLLAWELQRERSGFGLWERGRVLEPYEANAAYPLVQHGGQGLAITSPGAVKLFGSASQADLAFKACIAPLAELWPRGDYPRRSIRHHMVRPVYVTNPCDQFRNLYAETGRAGRDVRFAAAAKA